MINLSIDSTKEDIEAFFDELSFQHWFDNQTIGNTILQFKYSNSTSGLFQFAFRFKPKEFPTYKVIMEKSPREFDWDHGQTIYDSYIKISRISKSRAVTLIIDLIEIENSRLFM